MKPYGTVEKEIWETAKRKANEQPVEIISIQEEVRLQLGVISTEQEKLWKLRNKLNLQD